MADTRKDMLEVILELVSTLSAEEKQKVLAKILEKKEGLPISVFTSSLSGLESIVVFLKDHEGKEILDIANLLQRKKSTIYTTYHKAKEKLGDKKLDSSDSSIIIPYLIFADRKFAVLESLVAYLKDELNYSFVKISALLNKKYSTVRTVYVRYQKKCS